MRSLSDMAWRLKHDGVPHGDLAQVCRDRGIHLFDSVWGSCVSDANAAELVETLTAEHEQRQRDYLDAVTAEPPAPPLQEPTPAEKVRLYGGIENLSRASTDPAKAAGIKITDGFELGRLKQQMDAYYRPGPTGPVPEYRPQAPPRQPTRGMIPPEWKDGSTWDASTGELVE